MRIHSRAKVGDTNTNILQALKRKFDLTFRGLISEPNLERIWKECCAAEPRLGFLYEYAEEVAMTLFENQWEDESDEDEESQGEDGGEEEGLSTEGSSK